MRKTGNQLKITPLFATVLLYLTPVRNLRFVCAYAGPNRSIPALPAACHFLMKSDISLLMRKTRNHQVQKSDICMRMRRTEDKLPAVPAACTVLMKSEILCTCAGRNSAQNNTSCGLNCFFMKSDICMRMRRTEDKPPALPAACTVLMKA